MVFYSSLIGVLISFVELKSVNFRFQEKTSNGGLVVGPISLLHISIGTTPNISIPPSRYEFVKF